MYKGYNQVKFENEVQLSKMLTFLESKRKSLEINHSYNLGKILVRNVREQMKSGKDINNTPFAKLKFENRTPLNKTGDLRRNIKVKTIKTHVSKVYIEGKINNWKGNLQNNGGIIRPRKATFLAYKVNGLWIRSKKSIIPKREFFPKEGSYILNKSISDYYKTVTKIWKKGSK